MSQGERFQVFGFSPDKTNLTGKLPCTPHFIVKTLSHLHPWLERDQSPVNSNFIEGCAFQDETCGFPFEFGCQFDYTMWVLLVWLMPSAGQLLIVFGLLWGIFVILAVIMDMSVFLATKHPHRALAILSGILFHRCCPMSVKHRIRITACTITALMFATYGVSLLLDETERRLVQTRFCEVVADHLIFFIVMTIQ